MRRARAPASDADQDDPWLDKACAAALAARPKDAVRDHRESLRVSSTITSWFRGDREPNVLDVTPHKVIAALNGVGIKPVLMGTYGINGYRDQERATQDVDVLVTKKDVRKAVRVLGEAFPDLPIRENAAVARFLDPVTQKPVLDVMKPASRAMQAVFRHTIPIGRTHRIPDLEMALVSKFLAMTSENRALEKRYVDLGDFANIVKHNRADVNLRKLARLAAQAKPGGAASIAARIADVYAERPILLE